jgi:hypothetical protein
MGRVEGALKVRGEEEVEDVIQGGMRESPSSLDREDDK